MMASPCALAPSTGRMGPRLSAALVSRAAAQVAKLVRCRMVVTRAFFFGGGKKAPLPQGSPRRLALLSYVQDVKETSVQQFLDQNAGPVTSAMRQTAQNIVGRLPPKYFTVTIDASTSDLAELMFGIMLQAYMLRNAQFRLELQNTLSFSSGDAGIDRRLEGSNAGGSSEDDAVGGYHGSEVVEVVPLDVGASDGSDGSGGDSGSAFNHAYFSDEMFAPGTQKMGVQGEVLRWHLTEQRLVAMPTAEYIEKLEQELAVTRLQLQIITPRPVTQALAPPPTVTPAATPAAVPAAALKAGPKAAPLTVWEPQAGPAWASAGFGNAFQQGFGGDGRDNELLDYILSLPPHASQSLGDGASKDVVDAMHAFVDRMLGPRQQRWPCCEFNHIDLSKILMWLLVVGFTLRSMEARFDMEDVWQLPPGPSE